MIMIKKTNLPLIGLEKVFVNIGRILISPNYTQKKSVFDKLMKIKKKTQYVTFSISYSIVLASSSREQHLFAISCTTQERDKLDLVECFIATPSGNIKKSLGFMKFSLKFSG